VTEERLVINVIGGQ